MGGCGVIETPLVRRKHQFRKRMCDNLLQQGATLQATPHTAPKLPRLARQVHTAGTQRPERSEPVVLSWYPETMYSASDNPCFSEPFSKMLR